MAATFKERYVAPKAFYQINPTQTEVLYSNETELGGFKEISFMINGDGAYSKLKYESGVHRVQRIPSTESGGRIHTSTVTVAVLTEVEEVEVEFLCRLSLPKSQEVYVLCAVTCDRKVAGDSPDVDI